jgi:hypothetical protein
MHELMELKKKLIRELEEYSQNGKFSKEDVETIKYMASAVDHLCNILMDEDGEYSNRGDGYSNRNDGMSRNYGGGSYARGRGRNARRDSMGRYSNEGYSRADGVEELVDNVRNMMQDLPQNLQIDAKRFIQKLEQEI